LDFEEVGPIQKTSSLPGFLRINFCNKYETKQKEGEEKMRINSLTMPKKAANPVSYEVDSI